MKSKPIKIDSDYENFYITVNGSRGEKKVSISRQKWLVFKCGFLACLIIWVVPIEKLFSAH